MTDREKVIRELECCEALYNGGKVQCVEKCPYWIGVDGHVDTNCRGKLIEDALALLKAQEPRVMTLEEVTEDRPDVVWFDDRHYKLTYPAFVSNGEVTGWVVSLSKGCYERHDHIDGYGKEWRCWTASPTEEQRRAKPWDAQKQRDYEASVEMAEYCERFEPTYNAYDGSM